MSQKYMSSEPYKKLDAPKGLFGKLSFVSETKNSLADFVRNIIDKKGLNYREVAKNSGGLISHSAVYDIINGRSTNPKTTTLQGMAKGLGVTEEEIFAIARGVNPDKKNIVDEQFENLSLKFSGLHPSKKERAKALIEMMDREIERIKNEK